MSRPKEEKQKKPKPESTEPVDFNQLLDMLLQQKDELFEDTFLTKEDKNLIGTLPKEYREPVREALLKKGVLFKQLRGKYQRVGADYANYQKRAPKQIADTVAYEKEQIIKTVLPILDNFEHTLANAASAENIDLLIKGVKIIYDQMLDTLRTHGVEQIKALDEKFDPAYHQAIMQRYEPDKEESIVLEEFQKGYKLNGRVIRPSRVIVNKPPSEQEPCEEEPAEQEPAGQEPAEQEPAGEKNNLQRETTEEGQRPSAE